MLYDDYEKYWDEIAKLEKDGLTKSAFDKVEALYKLALKERNVEQEIKTLMYKAKFRQVLEENSEVSNFIELETALKAMAFPGKQILASYMAGLYENYYESNAWRIDDHTDLDIDYPVEKLEEWSRQAFLDKMKTLHLLALDSLELKNIELKDFNALISELNSKGAEFRNSMLDILAYRAMEFFNNDYLFEGEISVLEGKYLDYLVPPEEFVKKEITDSDDKSIRVLQVLQKIMNAHLSEGGVALLDADLERIEYLYKRSAEDEKDILYLNYLNHLSLVYSDSPALVRVLNKLGEYYIQKASLYAPGDTQYSDYYINAKSALDRAVNEFPDDYFISETRDLLERVHRKDISVQLENVWRPGTYGLASLNFRNLDSVYFRIYKIDPHKFLNNRYYGEYNVINEIQRGQLTKDWHVSVPYTKDYHMHRTEFGIDPLAYGSYAILASANGKFNMDNNALGYAFFTISDLSFTQMDDQKGSTILVYNRKSGKPISGVQVRLYEDEYNYREGITEAVLLLDRKTDMDGKVNFHFSDARKVYRVELEKGEDELILSEYFVSNVARPNKARSNILLMTDRAIYRPGQTAYVKGLAVHYSESGVPSLIPGAKGKVLLRDVNGKIRGEYKFKANEFGSFNHSFILPDDGLAGAMTIQAEYQKYRHTKQIQVEEYRRPKFKVEINTPRTAYALNDSVLMTGFAENFNGVRIDDGEVHYTVSRKTYYPWKYTWWYRSIFPDNSNEKIIASGVTKTNTDGSFEIAFKAIDPSAGHNGWTPAYLFTVNANVTDASGETRSGNFDLRLSEKAFFISANIPERINAEALNSIELSGENLNGAKVPISGKMIIEKLAEPEMEIIKRPWEAPDKFLYDQQTFKSMFPNRPYNQEDQFLNWKVEDFISELEFNIDSLGKVQINKELIHGTYKFTLIAEDDHGNMDSLVHFIQVDRLKSCDLAYGKQTVIDLNNGLAQPGEIIDIQLFSEKGASPVYYVLEKKGETSSKWMNFKKKEHIRIPVLESDRGGFHVHFFYAGKDQQYQKSYFINVPWTNKELDISLDVFRDKLYPGEKEKWTIRIKDAFGNPASAELLASLYDASLDAFIVHDWNSLHYPSNYASVRWTNHCYGIQSIQFHFQDWYFDSYYDGLHLNYPFLNNFGLYYSGGRYYANNVLMEIDASAQSGELRKSVMRPAELAMEDVAGNALEEEEPAAMPESEKPKSSIRENLNELVFFYPELYADNNGDVQISFTMNEALTSWKFMTFAHTKDLKVGMKTAEVKTSKDLMVFPNLPRFFRQGDRIFISGKIQNMLANDIEAIASLELFDPVSLKNMDNWNANLVSRNITVPANGSAPVSWEWKLDDDIIMPVGVRIMAESGSFSDGEQQVIPVLPNRMLVTESYVLPLNSGEDRKFEFQSLKGVLTSNTATMHQFTLEMTSNPAWYAVQALPYLMEYPYDCTEQVFSRLYANTLAAHIAYSNPSIKAVFEQWKDSDALLSALSKNKELKSVLLEETPWVRDAVSEEEQKKRIALLFDFNKMADEKARALSKIVDRQLPDGGFPWFNGPYSNQYITQYILEGIGHLDALNVDKTLISQRFVNKALAYVDKCMADQFNWLKKHGSDLNDDHLSSLAIHYLYLRSFYKQFIPDETKEAYEYFQGQAEKYWLRKNLYEQAMIALAKGRNQQNEWTNKISRSLKERSVVDAELGMYWKANKGYFWQEAPIERHALMIELFEHIGDSLAIDQLKTWLLKNKQTNAWETTKATASAVYALLLSGENWLDENELVQLKIAGKNVPVNHNSPEAGTGYWKKRWDGSQVDTSFADVDLHNPNAHIAWGSAYYQYFEDLDKITHFEETPLQLDKALFKKILKGNEFTLVPIVNSALKVGDEVVVRILLKVDRDMEFVHLKDMRASGLEPLNVVSRYKWKAGLGYYESTRDQATNFFFDYLPKGEYVFEYPLRVFHAGDFSNGISTIQCMYAPEFSAHSSGSRVHVIQE